MTIPVFRFYMPDLLLKLNRFYNEFPNGLVVIGETEDESGYWHPADNRVWLDASFGASDKVPKFTHAQLRDKLAELQSEEDKLREQAENYQAEE